VAFFLASDCGSDSAAARAAIDAARQMAQEAAALPKDLELEVGGMEGLDCRLNVAVHWGPSLYMGQLVTGGRLEVTALGDEVNECARILQSS
jgi:class 3 adenylate cyclase